MATEEFLRRHVSYWRSSTLPPALVEAASARGVDCTTAVFLQLEVDFPGMPRLFGLLLTESERFIRFEIDTDERHTTIGLVEAWRDVTEEQNLSMHNRGTGAGEGALGIKILHEFNADA